MRNSAFEGASDGFTWLLLSGEYDAIHPSEEFRTRSATLFAAKQIVGPTNLLTR